MNPLEREEMRVALFRVQKNLRSTIWIVEDHEIQYSIAFSSLLIWAALAPHLILCTTNLMQWQAQSLNTHSLLFICMRR
jgi:hypothetical protein